MYSAELPYEVRATPCIEMIDYERQTNHILLCAPAACTRIQERIPHVTRD